MLLWIKFDSTSSDPALIELLKKKRAIQAANAKKAKPLPNNHQDSPVIAALSDSNPAHELLQQSDEGNWLNFNLVEEHKLAWMRDIPARIAQLKPGQQFNARFDWKGVLLPHSLDELPQNTDDRDLYLHGEEPERPGYTLQELFRLARYVCLVYKMYSHHSEIILFQLDSVAATHFGFWRDCWYIQHLQSGLLRSGADIAHFQNILSAALWPR